MKTKLLITCALLAIATMANAQSLTGFWTVDNVTVGDRNLTPVAKWFRYYKDHTYEAGNGWTQNDTGTWAYDKAQKEFLPESRSGKDEYGPFKVSFDVGKMIWKREEDGMQVTVTLSQITEMPMAPKDSISGNWDLVSVTNDGKDITSSFDAQNKARILIRNTETYRKTRPDGSQAFGYWHMDGHAPEFHLIDFDRSIDVEVFVVSFKGDMLMMKPVDNEKITYTYKKI